MSLIKENAEELTVQMQWLVRVIDTRMLLYWQQPCAFESITAVPVPAVMNKTSLFSRIVEHYRMNFAERVILLIALAPHIKPHLLDVFFRKNADYDRAFTEFGGVRGQNHNGFIPTGETVAFVLAPNDLYQRFNLFDVFGEDHFFHKFNILKLENTQAGEPLLSGVLRISASAVGVVAATSGYVVSRSRRLSTMS